MGRARPGPLMAAIVGLLAATSGAACSGNAIGGKGDGAAADAGTAADGAGATAGDAAIAAEDTARGIVAVVGADPATRVVVRTPSGTIPVEGPVAEVLRSVGGVEVAVTGERLADGSVRASSFRVRGVGHLPASDGVLELVGGSAVLVTADGERVRYGPAPSALRALVGERVWIAGHTGEPPESWGRIPPRD